ncbi:MAG: glycosyltransferase family 2 protein [Bacteroidota bacterium]
MKISIVTVCYNSKNFIRQTLESVATQDYPNIEHVVIDGGSNDGTVEILNEYKDRIIFISEPDKGIYEAMNKGVKLATGEVIGTLGAGDFYPNNQVIGKVAATFERYGTDSIYGDKQYVHPGNIQKTVRYWKSGEYKIENWLKGWMPPHQSFYLKKKAFENYGYYLEQFRSAGDYELMLRMLYKHKLSTHYLPELLVTMLTGGTSTVSFSNRIKANLEDRKAWLLNGIEPKWYTLYAKPLSKVLQFLQF